MQGKLEQIGALQKKRKSLQGIIDEVYRILGNPIMLYDIGFEVLAYAASACEPFWDSFIRSGDIVQEIKDTYVSEGLCEVIISTKRPAYISNEKLKYDWIFGKIYDKDHMPIACVHVLSTDISLVDDAIAEVEAVCKLLSKEMQKIPYYQNFAQKKLDSCVAMLIDGRINAETNKLYIAGYVEMIYSGLQNNLYLAVVNISQCDPSYSRLTYYRDLFKQMRPAHKYAIFLNHIIIIMSADKEVLYPKRCLGRLNGLIEQENMKIGVSNRFENLYDLRKPYAEAIEALH